MSPNRLIALLAAIVVFSSTSTALTAEFKIGLVSRAVGPTEVEVEVTSSIPGTIEVMLSLGLAGQKPDDVFIGTDERITIKNGRATAIIGKAGLPNGEYEVEVSFYPRWGPQDSVAKAAGANSEIHARQTITLEGTGEPSKAAQQRKNDQSWVMANTDPGTPWDWDYWYQRFGPSEQLTVTRLNAKIIKAYYFKRIDMTIFVNQIKNEISFWRIGRQTE